MRKRTVSDVTFYQRYPYRPDLETVVQVRRRVLVLRAAPVFCYAGAARRLRR